MRRARGFTLLELMVAVSVLAILTVAAAPSFSDMLQRYRLRGAADEVASLLANARAEALMRNRDVSVVFTGSGSDWCVGATSAPEPSAAGDAVGTSGTCTCANTCSVGGRILESRGADQHGVTAGTLPAAITFTHLTGAVAGLGTSAAEFKSPNARYQLNVAVSPLGRGRLCVPAGKPSMTGFAAC